MYASVVSISPTAFEFAKYDDILRPVCISFLGYYVVPGLTCNVLQLFYCHRHQRRPLVLLELVGFLRNFVHLLVLAQYRLGFCVRADAFLGLGFGSQSSLVLGLVEHGRSSKIDSIHSPGVV